MKTPLLHSYARQKQCVGLPPVVRVFGYGSFDRLTHIMSAKKDTGYPKEHDSLELDDIRYTVVGQVMS